MRRGISQARRRGNVLVYFALITFVMFAMAALTIDMGFARLTHKQMQTGVESAALTGLRFRDHIPDYMLSNSTFLGAVKSDCGDPPTAAQSLADPNWIAWREKVRRWLASNQVALIFDDNLNPLPNDDDPMQFGAGPIFDLRGGIGQANAQQQIKRHDPPELPKTRVYKPIRQNGIPGLELNFANVANGDLVAGQFNTPTSEPSEDSSYTRSDFTPATAGAASAAPSFLVRMRRTNDFQSLDNVAGESSGGPALKFLFGRGSLITSASANNPNNYSPRLHGVSVRGTGIATVVQAKSVGPIIPNTLFPGSAGSFDGLPGITPFGMSMSTWNLGETKLATSINSTDNTLMVLSGSSFPPVPFAVLIDREILRVTALDATQTNWTAQRGTQGTTPAAHQQNVPVEAHLATTLAQPAQPTDTTLTVVDGSIFPAVPFAALIDKEIILVTTVGPMNVNSWTTVQRHAQGTISVAHPIGSQVLLLSYFDVDVQGKLTSSANLGTTLVVQAGTTLTVNDESTFPHTPFVAILDPGTVKAELVQVTGAMNNSWTLQNPPAFQHSIGALVQLYRGTTLAVPAVNPTATSINVIPSSNFPGATFVLPDTPFTVIIDQGTPTEEILKVIDVDPTKTSWTVRRGWLGTSAVPHSVGALIQPYSNQIIRITNLAAAIGAIDTSIQVSSGTIFLTTVPGFPIAVSGDNTRPSFLIRIDNELLLVKDGGRNQTRWTVVRAQEGTTAAPHSVSASVMLHQTMAIGQSIDALPRPPTSIDGSKILTSSPRSSQLNNDSTVATSFIPIFDDTTSNPVMPSSSFSLVIGFGQIQWGVPLITGSTSFTTVWLVKKPAIIVPQNATAKLTLSSDFSLDPQTGQPLSSTDLNNKVKALFDSHKSVTNSILVPALAR